VSESNKKSSAGFAVQKFIPPDFCGEADVKRVANRAMLLRLLRGEDLTTARSMCGFAACVRQTSYLKKKKCDAYFVPEY
jgi:hypothetical protein